MGVRPLIPALAVVCLGLAGLAFAAQSTPTQDEPAAQQEKPDLSKVTTFFAGTVAELTPEHIKVSRTVLGKTESRTFSINSDTKVEGKLRAKIRVTVRYSSDDNGDTAVQIIVRPSQSKKK